MGSNLTNCIIIKNDSLVHEEQFPQYQNKMPFIFKVYQTGTTKYISTYWFGGGNLETSIRLYIFEIKQNIIQLKYIDIVYLESYYNDSVIINNHKLLIQNEQLIIEKEATKFKEILYLNDFIGLSIKAHIENLKIKITNITLDLF